MSLAAHPDRNRDSGESTELQARLNVARDILNKEFDRLAALPDAVTDPPPSPGADEYREITFPFLRTLRGGRTRISAPKPNGVAREVWVDVPRGSGVDTLLHVPGAGGLGWPPGDLYLRIVAVEPDATWRLAEPGEGRPIDLVTQLTVTYASLYAERLCPVSSPWERTTIGLPLRADNFGPYRVRGHGVRRAGVAGDLLVLLDVLWPPRGNAELAGLLATLQG